MKFPWRALLLVAILFGGENTRADHSPLLPRPQQVHYGTGCLPVGKLTIHFAATPNDADRFAATELLAGLPIPTRKSHKTAVLLNRTGSGPDVPVDNDPAGPNSREAYSIKIQTNGVEIKSRTSAGLFYGVQTLLQMVEIRNGRNFLPMAEVQDWPVLAYRGFMMDFSEGQLLRVSEIERQLDLLARFKANQYYFYSEMGIAWPGYEVVSPDGRYTQDEVKHVIQYARQRHIDVVPCIELFGHMHQLLRTEKFADVGLPRYGDEFDMRKPRAQEVVDDLFDKNIALFSSPWIHVGFDEPWSLGKIGLTPGKDPFQMFVGALRHLADRAQQHGKRLLYWADIGNGASTLSNHPELLPTLPGNAIAVPWEYEAISNYAPYIEPVATNGLATMVAPAIWNWNEIFPDYHRTFTDINGLVGAGKKYKTLGILNTGWTDCAQTLYRQSRPGLAFGAIAGWQSEPVNTNTFFSEYCAITYPAPIAGEVSAALEELSTAEEIFEQALANATQHAFWTDPLQPGRLSKLISHRDELHRARLLAEQAMEHITAAERRDPQERTLDSLMMAARLFDYLGMKSLYAVEWDGYFKELKKNPDPKLVTLYIGIQMVQQGNGMIADLQDAITGLREPYRQAWLEESTPYRLGTALSRWDNEEKFWLDTWSRVNQLLQNYKSGEPFPSIDVIRAKPQ